MVMLFIGPVIIPDTRLPKLLLILGHMSPATYAASAMRQTLLGAISAQVIVDILAFHRSISHLLNICFATGFVLDGIEEPAFVRDVAPDQLLSWQNFPEIPPALVMRLRLGV
jgi:hypothetical protein